MILPLNLNRRHKVTLFLTVLLAGIAALNSAKMMEVVGILLLGLALAWAFGSDSRVVHWLFLSLGVLLACGTVGLAWLIHQRDTNLYAQKVAAFEQRIPELAREYPLHKNGQISWDKDLEPYLVKNPKAGGLPPESDTSGWTPVPEPQHESRERQVHPSTSTTSTLPAFDPATAKPLEGKAAPDIKWDAAKPMSTTPQPVPGTFRPLGDEPKPRESRKQARRPIPPDATVGNSGVTLDFSKAQPLAAAPATLPADFFSHLPGGLFQLTMPDGHVRYFAYKRDADHCSLVLFWDGKTQNLWNEAWVAGLDLSEVPSDELPGDPPKTPWEHDDWWVCLCLGVFLFALGLGLILGIRAKPLPT